MVHRRGSGQLGPLVWESCDEGRPFGHNASLLGLRRRHPMAYACALSGGTRPDPVRRRALFAKRHHTLRRVCFVGV